MPVQIMTGSVQGTGSQYLMVVNPDGSINANITGSITIGSVSANVDSVYIQSGANIDLGSAWTNIGSVVVSNFGQIGSIWMQNITGSVAQITDPWRITGSINSFGTGSMRVSEWGLTTPITTTGSFTSYGVGSFIVLGSVNTYGGAGGYAGSDTYVVAGSVKILSSTGSVGIYSDSALAVSGIVNQGTNPWITLGSVAITNTVSTSLSAGSMRIFGVSGVDNYPLLVTSGTIGILRTDVNSLPNVTINNPSTIGSFTTQNIIGSVAVTTSLFPVSGVITVENTTRQITAGSVQIYGRSGADIYPLLVTSGTYARLQVDINSVPTTTISGTITVDNRVAGSIVNMPAINISAGSINIISSAGSIGIYSASTLAISGIVNQGTNPWITLGSTAITNTVPVTFSAGSVQIYGRSGIDVYPLLVTSGTYARLQTDVNSILTNVTISGTVTVDNRVAGSIVNMPAINISAGSINIISSAGSIGIYSASTLAISGIVNQGTNPWGILGSVRLLGVSGADTYALATTSGTSGGFLRIDINNNPVPISGIVNQGTVNWGVSGTAFTTVWTGIGSIIGQVTIGAGSLQTYNPIGVGSVTGQITIGAGSIQTYSPVGIGSVRVAEWGLTTPITVTGSVISYGIGSIRIAEQGLDLAISGIVNIGTNPVNITPSGIFTVEFPKVLGLSGTIYIGSFTGSTIIFPGTGSKLQLKGYTLSAITTSQTRVFFSGGTTIEVGRFSIPNSGTIAMNLLGMEPSGGTNSPLSVGMLNTGSLQVSFFTRDIL